MQRLMHNNVVFSRTINIVIKMIDFVIQKIVVVLFVVGLLANISNEVMYLKGQMSNTMPKKTGSTR